MRKPDFDYIKGLPPAIAVEQKVNTRNPRSTVGTSTEIYDYLRMLYARIGRTYSPVSGVEVKRHTYEDILKCIFSYSPGTKFVILSRLVIRAENTFERQLQIYLQQGFSRIYHNGEFAKIEDVLDNTDNVNPEDVFILIDRLSVDENQIQFRELSILLRQHFMKVTVHAGLCLFLQALNMIFRQV